MLNERGAAKNEVKDAIFWASVGGTMLPPSQNVLWRVRRL